MEIIKNFIVLEGSDGCGTTTQLNLLKERLQNTKKPMFFPTFEPTDGDIGRLIRSALKKDIKFEKQSLAYLFAADRNEHLYGPNGIIERTQRDELVVSDRYIVSSLVYQGIECGDDLPQKLNIGFPVPELTIFLDIDPETAMERTKNRETREIYEYLDFQKMVYQKYLSVLNQYEKSGAKVAKIDASKTIEEVSENIWSLISRTLATSP